MDLKLTSARVIVTAGANGIGLKITERLLAEGASVYICDVDVAALDEAKEKHPSLMTGVCDVSKRDSVATMVEQAVDGLGGLDCLINNASIFEKDNLINFNENSFNNHMNINLKAPAVLTQYFKK